MNTKVAVIVLLFWSAPAAYAGPVGIHPNSRSELTSSSPSDSLTSYLRQTVGLLVGLGTIYRRRGDFARVRASAKA